VIVHTRRRTIAAAAASTVVALAAWLTAPGAGAQTEGGFANGTAKATALISRIAPGVGSLQLALGAGSSVAELRNGLAQSQSQAFDLGLIGTTLTAEGCDGGAGTLTPDQLPQPLRIDNRKGAASATADEAPVGGAQFGLGRKEVSATDEPGASATTTFGAFDLSPIMKIGGGKANAVAHVVDGKAREAVATTTMNLELGGGALEMQGLTWRALHRTGADPKVEGTFDMGAVADTRSPLGPTAVEPAEGPINDALASLGLSVQLPKVVHITEPADIIRVTPLRIQLKDSPAGATVLGPVLDATREQREELVRQVSEQFCQAAGALLVGDVAVTIAAGAGFLTIDIGGVEATTADVVFEDPFGSFTSNVTPGDVALPASGSGLPSTGGVVPSAPAATGGVATGGSQPAVATGPIERACESVNPVDWPPCSHGAALPLGLLGLGVTAGMAGVDVMFQRRRATVMA
jgi:hypothetical protein